MKKNIILTSILLYFVCVCFSLKAQIQPNNQDGKIIKENLIKKMKQDSIDQANGVNTQQNINDAQKVKGSKAKAVADAKLNGWSLEMQVEYDRAVQEMETLTFTSLQDKKEYKNSLDKKFQKLKTKK